MGQSEVVPYDIPEYSTVTIGKDKMTWNMCGSQSVNYKVAENTYFDYDNLETTPCQEEAAEGSNKMKEVLSKNLTKNQSLLMKAFGSSWVVVMHSDGEFQEYLAIAKTLTA